MNLGEALVQNQFPASDSQVNSFNNFQRSPAFNRAVLPPPPNGAIFTSHNVPIFPKQELPSPLVQPNVSTLPQQTIPLQQSPQQPQSDTTDSHNTQTDTSTPQPTPQIISPPVDKNVDLDGDGALSLVEVQYAAFVHHGLSSSVVENLFHQVDQNKDGYLTSIEFNKIRSLVLAKAENAAHRYLQVHKYLLAKRRK